MKGTSPSRASRAVAATGNLVPRWEVQCVIDSLLKGKSVTIVTINAWIKPTQEGISTLYIIRLPLV